MTGISTQCGYASEAQPYLAPCPEPVSRDLVPRWDETTLYGTGGQPVPGDVQQTGMGDCWLGADLKAIALQQPGWIQDAIRYDREQQRFDVLVHATAATGEDLSAVVHVTQADIDAVIAARGLGTQDDRACGEGGATWPVVMEAAMAKVMSRQLDGREDLATGLRYLSAGGQPGVAMSLLSGQRPLFVNFDPTTHPDSSASVGEIVGQALRDGHPVTLGVVEEAPGSRRGDGLMDRHGYAVSALQPLANGDAIVEVLNPLGHNRQQPGVECTDWDGTGTPDAEGCDERSATTTTTLSALEDAGTIRPGNGLVHRGFTIGQ